MTKVRLFKDLKNVKIEYKNMTNAFSMNQFGQNCHFFHYLLFSRNFWMRLKRRP